MLKLKNGVSFESLRKFGFKPGYEWKFEGCDFLEGCSYMDAWWHKFAMDPDEPEKLWLVEDNFPLVHILVNESGHIDIDACPDNSYHVEGIELDVVQNTIFDLTMASLVEKREV